MPEPNKGESKKEYIPRCVSYMIKQENREQKQALAICFSMWDKANESIENKIDRLLETGTITTDIEKNLAKGRVQVMGMKYKKKSRKNKLTGSTVVYERNN